MNNNNDTINVLRELAKNNKGIVIKLPIEMVDIIEGKRTEQSWKDIDVSKVMEYLASMIEV